MAESTFVTPRGTWTLHRPHTPRSSPLRAWSAADQLALDHLGSADLGRVLLVNDEFGALALGLAELEPTSWTDSVLSRAALAANREANGLAPANDDWLVTGDQVPTGRFDTVVLRLPKTSELLGYQLDVVASVTHPDSVVIGTGMARHVHRSTLAAFEAAIGATTTSLAKRKARLILPVCEKFADPPPLPAPEFTTEDGVRVIEHPGTFSAGHVDVGTALLLDVLRSVPSPRSGSVVADLGCGNGVIGTTLATRWIDSHFLLLDGSDLAVAAAEKTWHRNDLGERAIFAAQDGFGATPSDSVDVVVTNPPFHQGQALDRDLTDRLLADAARVLRPGGTAFVVAQRHLHLHTRLKRWFPAVEVVSKHPTHVVLHAQTVS